jgi:signal transduction histidine kinase
MAALTEDQLRRLIEVGRALVSELDPEAVLQRILEEAQEITGARYVALGVLDEHRNRLERFLTLGVEPEVHRQIGDLPRGRGVLGVLIENPQPLRLPDVSRHPESFGFPPGHPPMTTFLGVPIVIRGEAWGNLYLTEKAGGVDFTDADEEAAVVLAQWAATAIENARLYETSERRRHDAERAVMGLQAARDIVNAIAGEGELERVLELIVKRGRALVEAQAVLIMLREGDELVISASAGRVLEAAGHRLPIAGSTSGRVLERGRPLRVAEASRHLRVAPDRLGIPDAHTALLVPMVHRGSAVGVLAAFDRGSRGDPFTDDDEELLRTFASSAANAVVIHRSVEADRLRSAITAADAERARWARELHDQTLQALGGLRVLLASSLRRGDPEGWEESMRQAIEDIELETDNLRAIITDLRPSLLDDLGLIPAIEALVDRRRAAGVEIEAELDLPDPLPGADPELETTIYRVLQEALTNVAKHARASEVQLAARLENHGVCVSVRDNGVGFDPESRTSGFGLAGMRERVYLSGGQLEVSSDPSGTLIQVRLPLRDELRTPKEAARLSGLAEP